MIITYDYQCPNCKKLHQAKELKENSFTPYSCDECSHYLTLLSTPKVDRDGWESEYGVSTAQNG